MLWKVVSNKLCVVACKQNGLDDIKCIWELDDESLNVHCESQKRKVLLFWTIMLFTPLHMLVVDEYNKLA